MPNLNPDLSRYLEGELPQLSVEEAFQELDAGSAVVLVDVRTPKEFQEGRMASAVNVPLFSDQERVEIGTLYKQVNQQVATRRGEALVSGRIENLIAQFDSWKSNCILIYCARGGMRSGAVVRLLTSLGLNACQITGGFKAYRNYVLKQFEHIIPRPAIVINGQTGVGKTRLIQMLSPALDLESLAGHRGSLFGGVKTNPANQKQFENRLYLALRGLEPERPFFVEGESKKVGRVFLPKVLSEEMAAGVKVLVEAPLEQRVARIRQDYWDESLETHQQIRGVLEKLRHALSHAAVDQLLSWLKQERIDELIEFLLIHYYDPRYQHTLKKHHFQWKISAAELPEAKSELERLYQEVA